jgi:hypothetical protein
MRIYFQVLFILILTTLMGCNPVKTEISDSFLTNIGPSLTQSTLTVSSSEVESDSSIVITLRVKDQNGSPFFYSKTMISFSVSGGTSQGTLGPVSHVGDGVYTASFTGVTPGTPKTVQATINGEELQSPPPSIQVISGNYSLSHSEITVSQNSIQSASTLVVTLTLKDNFSYQILSGGRTVTFSTSGGTSTGTFGPVTDHQDGTYSSVFTGVKAGTPTSIKASINGSFVTSLSPTVTVAHGIPSTLSIVSGSGQSTISGSAITSPLVIAVKDQHLNLVEGAVVHWAVTSGGGSLTNCYSTTDANGLSRCDYITGTVSGVNTISASVNGITSTISFSVTGTAGAAASIAVSSGNLQSGTVGTTLPLPLIVLVKDINNNPVYGEEIEWSTSTGSLSSCSPATNTSGLAQCSFVTGTMAGTNTVSAMIKGSAVTTSFSVTGIAGPVSLSQSTLTMSTSLITSGSTANLFITLKDSYGNQIADNSQAGNISLTLLNSGTSSGTIGSISPISGNAGVYGALLTATTAGTTNTIKASLSSNEITSSNPSFTVNPGTASQLVFNQDPTSVASGETISPSIVVTVKDSHNNIVTGYSDDITLSIDTNPSSGSLSGTLTKTPMNGIATFSDLSIDLSGSGYKLSASSGTLTPATSSSFNISAISVNDSIPFTTSTTPPYTDLYTSSSWSSMEFVDNLVRLRPTVQTDSALITGTLNSGTASGVVIGTLADGLKNGLKLGDGGSCNGSTTNCTRLDSSWTPKWNNLVSYWRFDNNWSDSKGTNNGIAYSSPTFATGAKIGSHSASFSGTPGQYVATGASSSLIEGDSSISVSAWFNTTTLYNNGDNFGGRILTLYRGSASTKFAIGINGTNVSNVMACGDACSLKAQLTNIVMNDGRWHHIAATYNSTTDILTVYFDGVLSANTNVGNISSSSSDAATIGASHGGGQSNFNGKIDDVAIWNTALSASEIYSIYEHQVATYAGEYLSRRMDAKSSSIWMTLSWVTTLPFLKELPDYASGSIQNETSSDYSSLNDNNLMNGIAGLWHFNEASWTDVAGEVKDSSGAGNPGRAKNGATTSAVGRFGRGAFFDGVNDYVDLGTASTFNLAGNQEMTLSFWYRPTIVQYKYILTFMSYSTGWDGFRINTANTSDMGIFVTIFRGGIEQYVSCTGKGATWQHYTLVVDNDEKRLYQDGQLCTNYGTSMPSALIASTSITHKYLGAYLWAGSPGLSAYMDEVAFWHRKLNANEVKQLYQRGASRVKFQVRTCNDDACSGESWQGPDGTSSTYFSELNNNTSPLTTNGTVKPTLPLMTFSNFTSPPSDNQYFQYRLLLESDSATTTLMPEIQSVTVGPIHYDSSSPSIYRNDAIKFSEISSFSESLGANGCPGGIGYNLSLDKTNWKYWNGTAWVPANGTSAQSNSKAVIAANATTFGTQVGKGEVYVKAYLKSNGTQLCELDDISLSGSR